MLSCSSDSKMLSWLMDKVTVLESPSPSPKLTVPLVALNRSSLLITPSPVVLMFQLTVAWPVRSPVRAMLNVITPAVSASETCAALAVTAMLLKACVAVSTTAKPLLATPP